MLSPLKRLESLYLSALRGGITIETPQENPVLRTTIQFDGDIQNIFFRGGDGSLPDASVLKEILTKHCETLCQRIDSFASWRALTPLVRYGAYATTGGGVLVSFFLATQNINPTHEIMDLGISTLPLGLRFLAPKLIAMALQTTLRDIAGERGLENKREIDKLRSLCDGKQNTQNMIA